MKATRNTVQRDLVLNAVHMLGNHPTAEQIYQAVAEQDPHVSRGTVYRNLNLLADRGAILRVRAPGGPDHFDHLTRAHSHIRCRLCGKVFDLGIPPVRELDSRLGEVEGFSVEHYDLSFSGVCPRCKQRGSE